MGGGLGRIGRPYFRVFEYFSTPLIVIRFEVIEPLRKTFRVY
jgi:hypothetical protein